MGYVGNTPAEKYASFAVQNFTVTATTNYTLDHPVANENDIRLVINNVVQHPGSGKAYTASGTTLTLSEATAGTDTMYCVFLGKAVQTVTPSNSSVTSSMIVDGTIAAGDLSSTAVDNTNTNSTLITAQTEKTSLVDADKFLISDSASSGALKYVQKSNLGAGGLVKLGSSSVGASTVSEIVFDSIFSSTYESYRLIGFVNTDTAGAQTKFKLRASGSDVGSSQYTRIERHTYHDPSNNSTGNQTIHGSSSNEWIIAGGGMRTDSDSAPCWFDLTFFTNTSRQFFNGTASYVKNTNTQVHTGYVGGITQSNLSPDGIRIFPSSGNFRYAEISIFGVVQ